MKSLKKMSIPSNETHTEISLCTCFVPPRGIITPLNVDLFIPMIFEDS